MKEFKWKRYNDLHLLLFSLSRGNEANENKPWAVSEAESGSY
jgi:hypothetical protein